MRNRAVKDKFENIHISSGQAGRLWKWIFPVLALLTFIGSWLSIYPSALIERWYARLLFPKVSAFNARIADLISISWFDIWIPLGIVLLLVGVRRRQYALLAGAAAGVYLIFFWSWGLNYHRPPLSSKLPFDQSAAEVEDIDRLARRAAAEINRNYVEKQRQPHDVNKIREDASRRVGRVVAVIDGVEWIAPRRIKESRLANPWMRVAGIDGVFNPLVHEPVVSSTLLDIEQPFVFAHELAHVRGYPDEGDANLIALFATVMAEDPALQYSGWLTLWFYVRSRELDGLLDEGPRRDLQRISERAQAEQVRWISRLQSRILDWFLKANSVEEGVRSYSKVVVLAAGTQPYWERFR